MSQPAPTPEQSELLRQARRANLLKIWASGSRRLSVEERAEIADMIGNSNSPEPPSGEAGFTLDPQAPLPAKLRNYYKNPLKHYATVYGLSEKNGERTIKRWVSEGRHAKPPELPPLDEPGKMAAWWRKHKPDMKPSPLLLDLESSAPPDPPASTASPSADATPLPAGQRISAIKLDDLTLEEDEQVQQMAALVVSHFRRLKEASETGDSDGVRRWTPIHSDAVAQLDRTKKWAAERKKQNADWLPRAPVMSELSQLLEALRLSRVVMDQKIIAELERELEGRARRVLRLLQPALAAAIQKVRAREDDLLRNVETLRSPSAARDAFSLHAEAA